jgi:hypothetical protein
MARTIEGKMLTGQGLSSYFQSVLLANNFNGIRMSRQCALECAP